MRPIRLISLAVVFSILAVSNFWQPVFSRSLYSAPPIVHVPGDAATLQAAISYVPNGGIIELASGSYLAPSGGWVLNNLGKSFTIRGASANTVFLSGNNSTDIIRLINSDISYGAPIVFENLVFQNGYSATDGIAGAVTLQRAQATFLNVSFVNNRGNQPSTGGGGVVVALDSTAFFENTTWTGNSAKNYGGGLAINTHAKVLLNNSYFYNNRTNLPGHLQTAAGGGIHVGNSTLRVTNTRFENNQAGYVGGGIYSIGTWGDIGSDILVANCTFVNNLAVRDASVSFPFPTEGGAFHAEDLVNAKIYTSRFVTNSAMVGGGVNLYRSNVEIYESVFQGNLATGVGAGNGFGAAVSAVSNDTSVDGSLNRRTAYLRMDNSLVQGRYLSTTVVAQAGGGLYIAGDSNRLYGQNSVSQNGTAAQNRATVVLNNVVFSDLDVQEKAGAPGTGVGGAILLDLADLTMQNSLVMNSDAIGSSNSSGGGLTLLNQSVANISNSTFARNSTQRFGGAIFSQGSQLNLSSSNLFENANASPYGAAIFSSPDDVRGSSATGTVQTSYFSNNAGLPMIFDDDRQTGAINAMVYTNNQFYDSTGTSALVYKDSLTGSLSTSQLNSLVVNRSGGISTDKGSGNVALSSAPRLGKILPVPTQRFATAAYGDATPPTPAYLGYAWSGGSATLDGQSVTGYAGAVSASAGAHTLSVNGTNFTTSISQAPAPAATFTTSGNSPSTLGWSVTSGSFLDVAIDRAVVIPSSASGSTQVSPAFDTDYLLYIITKEGGVVKFVNTGLPILNVPASVDVLTGLNYPVNKGYFNIRNDGGGALNWTAVSQTPSLITIDTSSGQTSSLGVITFTLDVGALSPGDYTGTIAVDAGIVGASLVTVNVKVLDILYKINLPFVYR
ncbi:MAG: hypothetical protein Fur0035_08260 [Anaerolineales bacterium]